MTPEGRCETLEEAWEVAKRVYGDDVAQEAVMLTMKYPRDDPLAYLLFQASKLRGSGFVDQKSRNPRRRKVEKERVCGIEAGTPVPSVTPRMEDSVDVKARLEGLDGDKWDLLGTVVERGRIRGWRSEGLLEEVEGGKVLLLPSHNELTPENEERYRQAYAQGAYVPRRWMRKLGLVEHRGRHAAKAGSV